MSSASRSSATAWRSGLALLLVPLVAGCATSQLGGWRASGAAAAEPTGFKAPPPEGYRRGFDSGRTEDLITCLGSAAIVGGAAAAIYLKRYKGRGGGGSDVAASAAGEQPERLARGGASDPTLPAAPVEALPSR